jgi:diguanylate cyclase (GGDEF)-like protein
MMLDDSGRRCVLVVDDVLANIHVLGEGLMADYDVTVATNGRQALEMAASGPAPDLILLDILMPGMDGYEVCRRLKEDPATSHIPVIFITAKSEEQDETRGLAVGAVDYITKPFSMPIVKARVRTHLELKRHRDTLERLSLVDGLTGVPNRRHFDSFIEMAWRQGARASSPLSLLMIDIDYFKGFNDRYGHLAGDDCLRRVARALADNLHRPLDFVARYGGEEFACIVPQTRAAGALHIGELLRATETSLNIPHDMSPAADCVTVSVGIATLVPNRELSPSALIQAADRAVYRAKAGGRNRVASEEAQPRPTRPSGRPP